MDWILGVVESLLRASGQAVEHDLGTIGRRPQRHVLQHGLVETGNGSVHAGGRIRKRALPRQLIGNHADIADREALPESFVVAEQKQLVLLNRSAERAAELIPTEGRGRSLVESAAGV